MDFRPHLPNQRPRLVTPEARRDLLLAGMTLAALGLLALLFLASPARAGAGLTIPERKDALCAELGLAPGCTPAWESGKWGHATLTITVENNVDEPDAPHTVSGPYGVELPVRATTLALEVKVVNSHVRERPVLIAQTYQLNPIDYYLLTVPPCITPARRAAREQSGVAYSCLTEEELVGQTTQVVEKLPWSYPDFLISRKLQKLHGASGVPVAMFVGNVVVGDGTLNELASTFRAEVVYVFAVDQP